MKRIEFRFYAELNDFVPSRKRQRSLTHPFSGEASVKDLIESQGIPHSEVDLVLVNGGPVDFSYLPREGDRIAVYPKFTSLDIAPFSSLRPQPIPGSRFVLDVHLGKLARYLRLLGFDCLYRNDRGDADLVRISSAEGRILLTRNVGLLMRASVIHGYWLRQTETRRQLREVLLRFDLFERIAPFTRCLLCNGLLHLADKREIREELPPRVARVFERFVRCLECGKIYWRGSHYDRMSRFVATLCPVREGFRKGERGSL
ncbi:Mut7-C RNAse domain-containing protein [Verrucomicrobium sp. 3C]|uniref:Mut7-C RNAse domain-containing protein n=1 Tax=Verrucomicrobium sp. 3C TaxID=1134055 RepID=UPI0003A2A339|nr:Mut7-C RNAse domain-containing protein [Verrucomicrobium sp. 3C]